MLGRNLEEEKPVHSRHTLAVQFIGLVDALDVEIAAKEENE